MKKGITLVEVIIVVGILMFLVAVAIGSLDTVGIFNRARDARRKKDVYRIKVAFEDYYTDKGCYPSKEMVESLNSKANCYGRIFAPWLSRWPCDPNDRNYYVQVGYDDTCPKWFKVFAILENQSDDEISERWRDTGIISVGVTDYNFGMSSANTTVEEVMGLKDPYCALLGGCYYYPDVGGCNRTSGGCSGENCYFGECSLRCQVECCGLGCN